MPYQPDFEITDNMQADWEDWYVSVLELKMKALRKEALKRFAETHGITERQAAHIEYYTKRIPSQEKLVNEVTDVIVELMYEAWELPYPQDYDEARAFTKKLLWYGDREKGHKRFLYTYPDDVADLLETPEAKRLYLNEEKMAYIVHLVKSWHGRYHGREAIEPTLPRRKNWKDLDEPSPYLP